MAHLKTEYEKFLHGMINEISVAGTMRNVGKIKYEMFFLDLKIKDKRTSRKFVF